MFQAVARRAPAALWSAAMVAAVVRLDGAWAADPDTRGAGHQVRLFDTAAAQPGTLDARALAERSGWHQVPEDETAHDFRGHAVVQNDRLALLLRKGASGAEVYARGQGDFRARAVLAPGGAAARLSGWSIVENTPSAVALDAAFAAPGGPPAVVRFELALGQAYVKTEARRGAPSLRVEAPCRFVVLPDFFADDIVVDAGEIPVERAELPSENFLLHMLPGQDAIVMIVSEGREDARVVLAGQGADRQVRLSEIRYGKAGRVWVAVLDAPQVWHLFHVSRADAARARALDWKAPYPAQWRVDWRTGDQLTSSWEMIAQRRGGDFEKLGWFGSPETIRPDRKRWTTVLGWFAYPCWIDLAGRGFVEPLGKADFDGPAIVYPINRAAATPLDAFTVVDIVRATLGVGPCQYVLDVEGQNATRKGRATCATRDTLNPIYAAKQQKQRRAEIERALVEVLDFVKHIRARIEDYRAFGHAMLGYLAEQRAAHPELAAFLTEMETLTRAIEASVQRRKDKIQTPEYVATLTEKFRATLLDYDGPDALDRCKAITGAIVVVGGNQDELVGECRVAVKNLRQRAGLAMAIDPRAAPVANEIRRRAQEVLRNPASYEAPRH